RAKVEAAGSQITTPDKQAFIDAMGPVYEKHVKDDKLKAMVEAIRAVQ
ncbi:MAG: TRAP transporter substrate-binding protein, partial [Mesorhizobium sp.]